ncbi:MAG: hypothetical protein KC910_31085 [Candidatus Eremiobacteraeota bacterium]|nr:hypothetical protein [Candidatus Eremiobacteraeota bacterium]
MAATRWEYESISVRPAPDAIKLALEELGERGFQVLHVRDNADGNLLMMLGRDTGRPALEDAASAPFTDSQYEMMAVNWTPPTN